MLAHVGRAPAPHDAWTAWTLDPAIVVPLVVLLVLHERGRVGGQEARTRLRARAFHAGWTALVVALVSPLDAVATALASAHMVQHVLLVLVAAPLFAVAAPMPALLRGLPPRVAQRVVRLASGPAGTAGRALGHPVVAWLLHVGTLWTWHASAAYDAAVANPLVHGLEHATFLATAVLVWRTLVGPRHVRLANGAAVLAVFGLALQSVLLSALLTFAGEPWYDAYVTTAAAWGLDPLADQQLAGAIMWFPAGAVHVGTALALLVAWIRSTEDPPAMDHHAARPARAP